MIIFITLVFVLLIFVVTDNKRKTDSKERNESVVLTGGIKGFTPTRSIESFNVNSAIYIDEKSKKIFIGNDMTKNSLHGWLIRFDEVIECSILEDGATVQSGSLGRAIVGGAMAGGIGAVIGATTGAPKSFTRELSVRIVTSNMYAPLCIIPIITSEINRASADYKQKKEFAQRIYATIIGIIHSNQIQNGQKEST